MRSLLIDRDYITQGMRARAAEVAESWLRLRSEQEIEESLNREIEQERWTRIDRCSSITSGWPPLLILADAHG